LLFHIEMLSEMEKASFDLRIGKDRPKGVLLCLLKVNDNSNRLVKRQHWRYAWCT
jgi:hypothetical protein